MSELTDYVREYGDITWEEKGVCVEDLLVLAQLTYLKFKQYVPKLVQNKKGITIKALSSHPGWRGLFEMEWLAKDNCALFLEMAQAGRYQDILLRNYADIYDAKYNIQFAAVTYILPDGTGIVSFRGTDEFLAGWMEDSRLAFDKVIPGEEFARAYLSMTDAKGEGIRYVIGHSKGGTLAEYAALHAAREIRKKLIKVYNFDGPAQKNAVRRLYLLCKKYRKIVPRDSVVGMLFETAGNVQVVASGGVGLMQHNLHVWIIKNGKLQRIRKTGRLIRHLERSRRWLGSTNLIFMQKYLEMFHRWMDKRGNENLWISIRKWKYHKQTLWGLRNRK